MNNVKTMLLSTAKSFCNNFCYATAVSVVCLSDNIAAEPIALESSAITSACMEDAWEYGDMKLPRWIEVGVGVHPPLDGQQQSVLAVGAGPPMRFVLITPGSVTIEKGLHVEVVRPYYIAVEEVTIAQAALLEPMVMYDPDGNYISNFIESQLSGLPDRVDTASMRNTYANYMRRSDNPALLRDAQQAAAWAHLLTRRSGINVRMPSLAEWFLAMRAGSDTQFWWGDSWDPQQAGVSDLMKTRSEDPHAWLAHIRNADDGTKNPHGMVNLFGNTAELVYPSDKERDAIRQYISDWPDEFQEWDQMLSYSYFILGGDVANGSNRFPACAVSLRFLITYQDATYSAGGPLKPIGVRLVIDVPD